MKRVQRKRLTQTVAGVTTNIKDVVVTNSTVTTDGVFQSGNWGFMSLVNKIAGGAIAITYQLSYDGSTWFTPSTTDGTTLTAAGTIVAAATSDCWIILNARMAHYIRFIYTVTGTSTLTADALWQDES